MIEGWRSRPGLAGGIDKDGSRAGELLALGFASVEFGTVTPQIDAVGNSGVAILAARLAVFGERSPGDTAIGVGLGMRSDGTPSMLACDWLAGMRTAYDVADYLSFNLSARAYRPLLVPGHYPAVAEAIAQIAAERRHQLAISGRRVALALKFPLGLVPLPGEGESLVAAAIAAGFDVLTAVLPEGSQRLPALAQLADRVRGEAMLLAVGGIRTAADVHAALAAGAHGVQVHTAFAEQGAACLPPLLAGFAAPH